MSRMLLVLPIVAIVGCSCATNEVATDDLRPAINALQGEYMAYVNGDTLVSEEDRLTRTTSLTMVQSALDMGDTVNMTVFGAQLRHVAVVYKAYVEADTSLDALAKRTRVRTAELLLRLADESGG